VPIYQGARPGPDSHGHFVPELLRTFALVFVGGASIMWPEGMNRSGVRTTFVRLGAPTGPG